MIPSRQAEDSTEDNMQVSIVYHSDTGNTAKMAELVSEGCRNVSGVEARCMSVDDLDEGHIERSGAVIFGSPTYDANPSWQLKKCLNDISADTLAGKLGAVFMSQHGQGGGGGSFAEISIIANLLVKGMLVYSGGVPAGDPYLHFGAVSLQAPEEALHIQRCIKLGENVANKTLELFQR